MSRSVPPTGRYLATKTYATTLYSNSICAGCAALSNVRIKNMNHWMKDYSGFNNNYLYFLFTQSSWCIYISSPPIACCSPWLGLLLHLMPNRAVVIPRVSWTTAYWSRLGRRRLLPPGYLRNMWDGESSAVWKPNIYTRYTVRGRGAKRRTSSVLSRDLPRFSPRALHVTSRTLIWARIYARVRTLSSR